MKKWLALILCIVMAMSMTLLAGCGGSDSTEEAAPEETVEVEETAEEELVDPSEGGKYGYAGVNPIDAATYKYLVEDVSASYDPADVSIPIVQIVGVDDSKAEDTLVWGDFWINNYNINGDTLECVSGGNYPGVMHLAKSGDFYEVTSFDVVEDGGNFESSAKDLFGDKYDNFMSVMGDQDTREEVRAEQIAVYVKANGLEVTKYQDTGWDPVDIPLQ